MSELKKIRKAKKISQVELALRLGINQASVSAKEKDGIFNLKTAAKYAKALGCKPQSLLENIGNANIGI